nr:S-layer homology domain-containing protein [uncultured Oscillibacter sp.]
MKKILPPLLALLCLLLPVRAADFYDLPQNHWAGAEIRQALDAGVVNGYGDGSFQPTRKVTAAQFCAMLTRSFLAEEHAAAKEGKYQAMEACLPVLEGTSIEATWRDLGKRWDRYVDQPLSRYDMAQIVYNLIVRQDALHETITLSTTEIADWNEIPDGYHSAVLTCWGLGILKGQSDGRFAGEDTLNRAQAAVIWSRLDTLFNGPREEPKDPDEGVEEKEMPAFGLQGDETVREMMKRVNAKTPLCEEGRLPNGKSRTEENIQELLELVKQGCPDGTVWSDTIRYDYTVPRLGPTRGCRSFGLAVSDFVFGEDAPITQHRDLRSLSVGDVIHIQFEEVERVLILTGVDREEGAYTACELEKNGKVDWDQWGPLSGLVDATGFTMVYSRWRNA